VATVPSPHQFAVAEIVTADNINTYYQGILFLQNPPICVCYAGAVQSIPNATWTSLLFNLNRVDTYGGHSVTTNTSRYTAQVAGWYNVSGIAVAGSATVNNWGVRLAVNGTAVLGTASNGPAYGGAVTAAAVTVCDVFLNVNDFVEVQVSQSSGGALNTGASGTDYTSLMRVRWVHV
jgi:hypothetical protein